MENMDKIKKNSFTIYNPRLIPQTEDQWVETVGLYVNM